MQPTQRVRQQIKHLTLWRSTFYAGDFPTTPRLSFKELLKVYLVFCNLCHAYAAPQHRELALQANALSFPMDKSRGLPRVLLAIDLPTVLF